MSELVSIIIEKYFKIKRAKLWIWTTFIKVMRYAIYSGLSEEPFAIL